MTWDIPLFISAYNS